MPSDHTFARRAPASASTAKRTRSEADVEVFARWIEARECGSRNLPSGTCHDRLEESLTTSGPRP